MVLRPVVYIRTPIRLACAVRICGIRAPARSQRRRIFAAQQDATPMAEQRQHASLAADAATDPDKPVYHVQPRQGWANDGNGFIFFKGRHHIGRHDSFPSPAAEHASQTLEPPPSRFFQHIPDSSDWDWRMCWGHVSSGDLVNWEHEPIALRPTPGGPDEKGCWSGCCAVDQHGVPTILYTGVRHHDSGPTDPPVEVQCAATASPGDDRMHSWTKVEKPVIPAPPPGLRITGFRDPYVIQRGGGGRDWLLVLGSGIEGRGGALLLYRSQELSSGWEYVGTLCEGSQNPANTHDTGAMWECPFFIPLPAGGAAGTGDGGGDYIMCVSPYPHVRASPTNTCLYWIGRFDGAKFDLENAKGPFLLDLGDALYAPNCFSDGQGRDLMLGWFQELGARGQGFNYSGCLTLPRVLSRHGDRLHQAPAPELLRLRSETARWHGSNLKVSASEATAVPDVAGSALNLEVTIDTGASSATALSVLLLSSGSKGGNGTGAAGSATVTLDWSGGTLKVAQIDDVDAEARCFDLAAAQRSVGGPAALQGGTTVTAQIFLDHSALEVFLGSGETLTTRLYRRNAPSGVGQAGVWLLAHGGEAAVASVAAYEMGTIWRGD